MRKQKIIKQKIKVLRKLLNKSRDTLSSNEINEIRHNLYKKETIYDFLTNKDKLKSNEQRVLNRIDSYLNELYDDLSKVNIGQIIYLDWNNCLMMFITSLLR